MLELAQHGHGMSDPVLVLANKSVELFLLEENEVALDQGGSQLESPLVPVLCNPPIKALLEPREHHIQVYVDTK